jgi:hypothetical protein
MENYTSQRVKSGLTIIQKDGVTINKTSHEYTASIHRQTNIQGTKLMKVITLTDAIEAVIASKTDAKLFSYVLSNCKGFNTVVKHNTATPADAAYLAKHFDVSVQKVRTFLRKTYDASLLKRVQKTLVVNPYILIPYIKGSSATVNDQIASQLQHWWSSNPTKLPEITTIEEQDIFNIAASEFFTPLEELEEELDKENRKIEEYTKDNVTYWCRED